MKGIRKRKKQVRGEDEETTLVKLQRGFYTRTRIFKTVGSLQDVF
jgi:hypothetical protein